MNSSPSMGEDANSSARLEGVPRRNARDQNTLQNHHAKTRDPLAISALAPNAAPTPSPIPHWASREGLSSSVTICPCIPRPIRRRVLRGCKPSSTPLPWPSPEDTRLGSLWSTHSGGRLTTRQTSLYAADCRLACLPLRRRCQRVPTPGLPPACDNSQDFVAAQLLGGWDLTETGRSPASTSQLHLDTPPPLHLFIRSLV